MPIVLCHSLVLLHSFQLCQDNLRQAKEQISAQVTVLRSHEQEIAEAPNLPSTLNLDYNPTTTSVFHLKQNPVTRCVENSCCFLVASVLALRSAYMERASDYEALREECAALRVKVAAGVATTGGTEVNARLAKELEETKTKLASAELKMQRLKEVVHHRCHVLFMLRAPRSPLGLPKECGRVPRSLLRDIWIHHRKSGHAWHRECVPLAIHVR